MHLTMPQLLVALFISSLVVLSEASPWRRFDGLLATHVDSITDGKGETTGKDVKEEEVIEDPDFEDDYPEELITAVAPYDQSANSVTHLHQERGEVLVPCFGMWWPVGGTTYEYGGDYYGDYKRKRRRSRKQKKAARTKKKKS